MRCAEDEILLNGECRHLDDLCWDQPAGECVLTETPANPDAYTVEVKYLGGAWMSVAMLLLVVWAILASLLLWDAYLRRRD